MPENIESRVRALIAKHLGRPETDLRAEARMVEDLGADSLDLVELLQILEDEFQTSVDERDAAKLRTVSDIIDYVGRLQMAAPAT